MNYIIKKYLIQLSIIYMTCVYRYIFYLLQTMFKCELVCIYAQMNTYVLACKYVYPQLVYTSISGNLRCLMVNGNYDQIEAHHIDMSLYQVNS